MERWEEIPNFNGRYLISNYGRVKSQHGLGRILKPKLDRDGYHEYCLRLDNRNVYKKGHRLVAEIFIPNPDNLPCVNHLDNNGQNNHEDNLEWCTVAENTIHAYSKFIATKGKCASNLSSEEFSEMIAMYKSGKNYTEIRDHFSLSCRPDYIGEILSGRKLSTLSKIEKDMRSINKNG